MITAASAVKKTREAKHHFHLFIIYLIYFLRKTVENVSSSDLNTTHLTCLYAHDREDLLIQIF